MNLRAHLSPAALLRGRFSFWIVVALATWFWAPAMFLGRAVISGDYAVYSLPLMRVLHRAVLGHESMLWVHNMIGGHPLFAEGQGGFANPLNVLVAILFEPVRALGVVQWASLIIAAGGVFFLCRLFELRYWSATFAALSAGFSGTWIAIKDNLPVSGTIAWAPWLLLAFEYWWRKPSFACAALMAVPAALMILSGYPQIAYATMLYLVVLLFARLSRRELDWKRIRQLTWTGALAVVLALALAAIQLLPLLELVELSHRSQGVGLAFGGILPLERIVRGLFYFSVEGLQDSATVHNLANIAAAMLFGLVLFLRPMPNIAGHLFAGLFVFNMGMARSSPLFELLYDRHLLPGMHNFRTVAQPYMCVALIGVCITAGSVVDRLAADRLERWAWVKRWPWFAGACLIAYLGALGVAAWSVYTPTFSPMYWFAPLAILACYALLRARGLQRWLPAAAVLCLAIDALALRMDPFVFQPRAVLAAPRLTRPVINDPELSSYRVLSLTIADGMTLETSPKDPGLRDAYARVLKSLSYLPSMEWGVPTFNGQLALPLSRWRELESTLKGEAQGEYEKPSGLRAIDVLGVRYIAKGSPLTTRGLRVVAQDGEDGLTIYLNIHAQPMFQLYGEQYVVANQQAAIERLRDSWRRKLFLEKSFTGETPALGAPCDQRVLSKLPIQVATQTATRYTLDVELPCDAWLFLADANYPGWEATVNGASRPVFTAQVLGKAVQLTGGRNHVEFAYRPRMFYLGAAISACGLLVLLALALVRVRLRHARSTPLREPV